VQFEQAPHELPACSSGNGARTLPAAEITKLAKDRYECGKWAEAERLCRGLLNENIDCFETLTLLGVIAAQTQRMPEALELLSRAISIEPNRAEAYGNLGNVFHSLTRHEEALKCFEKALKINPELAQALCNRGIVLYDLNRHTEALESYDRALKIQPDFADALINRGIVLRRLKRHDEALTSYNRASEIQPNNSEALINRGNALLDLRRHSEALKTYDHAIRSRPDSVDAHMNLADCLLRLGDFARGWEEYEWRWQLPKNRDAKIALSTAAWVGQKLHGSLLVWNEQGLGDEIFFAGMLNDLALYADSITVCVDDRLVRLFQRSFGNMHVISRKTLSPDAHFDAHIPLGGLGRYLRRSYSALSKWAKPYLRACPARALNLRANIAQEKRLLCGLSWLSKNPAIGMDKTLRLQDLEPLLRLPGIDFVDLQYGDTVQEQVVFYANTTLSLKRVTEIDNFNDIDGLAALIEACDVVLTVSNTTAHLAAALGKQVLLLLPFSQGLLWYWHTEREDSPWYPTVRLFRQPAIGDWRSVIAMVGTELARYRANYRNVAITEACGNR
jgi:Tfp pilus assembly protein PilF